MSGLRLSIIINTYNRRDMLLRCLDTLGRQDLDRSCYEILIVDDGSADSTVDAVRRWRESHPGAPLREIAAEHRGYAAARNAGIRAARGPLVLFMGDDILLWPGALEEHLREHERFPDERVAVLGYVCWDPSLQSPVTDYAAQSGFGFEAMLRSSSRLAPWHAFYTCNISLKRSLLERAGGFNEALLDSPYDDTELGYRLARDYGLVLRLNFHAGAFHYHPLDGATLRERLRGRRRLMPLLFQVHPELLHTARPRMRYRLLNLAARLLSPLDGVTAALIRALTSLRQRGWESYPILGDYPEVRCDLDPHPKKDEARR
ncbi:MAG TPA: glycosyltransferase family 2 protein [Bryobacterales bacterium]|nr:glycosyltransferase family 2 protein [Bryobacterales bacterium]